MLAESATFVPANFTLLGHHCMGNGFSQCRGEIGLRHSLVFLCCYSTDSLSPFLWILSILNHRLWCWKRTWAWWPWCSDRTLCVPLPAPTKLLLGHVMMPNPFLDSSWSPGKGKNRDKKKQNWELPSFSRRQRYREGSWKVRNSTGIAYSPVLPSLPSASLLKAYTSVKTVHSGIICQQKDPDWFLLWSLKC